MKLLTTQKMKIFLSVLFYYPLAASADLVVVENLQGESYVLEVNAEDTFLNVVDSIHAFRQNVFFADESHLASDEELNFTVRMISKNVTFVDRLAKKLMALPRSYSAGIKPEECADITYIVKTMANSSLPKIKIAETSLKKAGDRIDHLHPFYFLSCIFTNEELKVCMRNLHGRAWVWKEFLKGIVTSMAEEDGKGNVLPFAADFAKRVKIDVNAIKPLLEAGRWEHFVDTLIEIVPREGGSDRYNM
ncbi:MAG TPA: hypothetical protein VGP47_01245 [Parachlamydiaceae bacterium]|nr:hypothetical protein [Parachlamydiaceae bacterium]